ncbi:MAG TPA: efflux RND transporter periplasmic adaptor subunit [Chthoniobacterales bacterium]|nr:efflux RND transporter periplasmic adaptor subunit [Chthoniobacterales bacterium]
MKKFVRYLIASILMLVVVAAIYGGFTFFKVNQIMGFMQLAKSGAFAPPPTAVTSTVAQKSEWQPTLETIGTVVAINGVTISTDLAGIVCKIAFESGSEVKAGDLLVQLNTDQEQAQLAQAEAQRDWTQITLTRNQDLLAKRTVSQSDFDSATAQFNQARATVDQYKAVIARKTLRAPFTGIVGIRQVNLGQYLNTGDAVVTLQSFDPIYVNFSLPQQDLSKVTVGQAVEITLDAYGDQLFTGKITAINSLVDQNSRNVQIQATLPNADTKLRPGMYAKVKVVLPDTKEVVAIPTSSIHYAPYGDSVFIVSDLKSKDGKTYKGVTEQFVKLGQSKGDLTAIVSGLKPGDEVVTSGVFRLRSGGAIIVNNKTTPGSDLSPNPSDS